MPSRTPPRRTFRVVLIVMLAAVGTTLAAVGGWHYARASAPVNGPIVLISIDTLRADHLPVYGYTGVRTPAIDALAADGVVFERAYSHAPQTLPAHAAILSGRLPFETGVRDNIGFSIKPGARLLPEMLRDRGYATGGVVSAFVLRKETGIAQGFDFFDADLPPASPEVSVGDVQRPGIESEQVAEHWLDRVGTSRFFLFLHLYEPHKPYTPPARYAEYAPYDGEIAYVDEIVGRFVAYLKSHRLYDRATIVLLADHGEGLGDHGEQEHGLFLYDDTIHVPLIVKQADGEGAGRRVTQIVQQIDLVPTILDLVKAPIPGSLRGRSLKPLLDGTGPIPEESVYSEALYARYHFGWSGLTALTDGRYRYIEAPREELYDLQHDPHERDNIAGDRPQAAQALRAALDRLSSGAPLDKPAPVSADTRARLQALGYVGAQAEVTDTPGDRLPDPKDKLPVLEAYRQAVELAEQRRFLPAIEQLRTVAASEPEMADVWDQLGALLLRTGRPQEAAAAYKHFIALKPDRPNGYMGAATALLQLKQYADARTHAELAAQVTPSDARAEAAAAHGLIAKIAVASGDPDLARTEAAAAEKLDPTLPMSAFVNARILYDQGKYDAALPLFQQALDRSADRPMQIPELHFYAGDTLARLEHYAEAERQFREELRYFPQNSRAYASLAMLYRAAGRDEESDRTVEALLKASPVPDSYALAARLWTMFGEHQRAGATRAEARHQFGADRRRAPAR